MKATFSTGLLAVIATIVTTLPAEAQPIPTVAFQTTRPSIATTSISPADLVTFGYRGYLQAHGITGGQSFRTIGQEDAEQLVQGAIRAGWLPADAINNANYMNAVRLQLQGSRLH